MSLGRFLIDCLTGSCLSQALAPPPMAPASLKKTIQAYKAVEQKLQGKLEQLRRKKEELDSRAFTVIEEGGRSPDREGQWLAEQDVYRTEVS